MANFASSQKKGLLALPRVEGRDLIYRVVDLYSLIPSKWGILEPNPKTCPLISLELLRGDKRAKSLGVGFRKQFSEIPLKTYEGDTD